MKANNELQDARFRIGSDGVTNAFIQNFIDGYIQSLFTGMGIDHFEIYLKQERRPLLIRVIHYGRSENFWMNDTYIIGKSPLGKIAQTVEIQSIDLAKTDISELNPAIRKSIFNKLLCFSLPSEEGTIGVLCVAQEKGKMITTLTRGLLKSTANFIGSIIHHERVSLELKRQIVMEERERIGMDLHDGIIQSLYGVGLTLQNAQLKQHEPSKDGSRQINIALKSINEAIKDIRAYILDLRPRQLRDKDLYLAIQSLVREFRANTMVEVELESDLISSEKIPEENIEILFHICQEALANVAKHAKASKVTIRIWQTPQRLMLRVSDDGVGFDLAKINQRLGHGLSNMSTRAEAAGGGIEIIPIRHQGTNILAWVPVN